MNIPHTQGGGGEGSMTIDHTLGSFWKKRGNINKLKGKHYHMLGSFENGDI